MKPHLRGLSEHSVFYKDKAAIYEKFSEAEDAPNKILKILLPKLKNKVILDIGCGTGKYAKLLAPHVKSYYGLDISQHQLSIAKKKVRNLKNIKLVRSDATNMKLPKGFFDATVSFWAISPIAGYPRKEKALTEALRVLKPRGTLYLIENDIFGTFDKIRSRHRHAETHIYNRWVKNQKFKIGGRVKTYFEFSSRREARKIFGTIWGKEVSDKIQAKKIGHQIIIFTKRKP